MPQKEVTYMTYNVYVSPEEHAICSALNITTADQLFDTKALKDKRLKKARRRAMRMAFNPGYRALYETGYRNYA